MNRLALNKTTRPLLYGAMGSGIILALLPLAPVLGTNPAQAITPTITKAFLYLYRHLPRLCVAVNGEAKCSPVVDQVVTAKDRFPITTGWLSGAASAGEILSQRFLRGVPWHATPRSIGGYLRMEENVHKFFNLLALEMWGFLFFLGETEEALTEAVFALRQERTGRVTEGLVGEAHRAHWRSKRCPAPLGPEAACSRAAPPPSGNARGAGMAELAVCLLPKLAGRVLSVG
jgi:hypothetical protein